tara:strand:- start:4809 stop:6221 length:1413 start_codon:yes stop_codon:yes gene_type:complete
MNDKSSVVIIGGGLAGAEAAWQVARAGIRVTLVEMRPSKRSPAHHTNDFAELVCSNSFGSHSSDRAAGLLQHELRELGSLVIETADNCSVPAGGALAVDRSQFSKKITTSVSSHPLIEIERRELKLLPNGEQLTIIATGPLTSESLAEDLKKLTGINECHFFDAASPIVTGESIDFDFAFKASRYDKGEADYVNCPMDKSQYIAFRSELINAEQAELKDFDRNSANFFEGCLPIEELAKRGEDTMRYGPLKPIGLWDPRWGDVNDKEIRKLKRAYAVVQLRKEDKAGKMWNLVGFQTNLKWGEQKRIFRMIPGLQNSEFIRLGVMHRNTFLNSPKLLKPTLQFKERPKLFAAGQITGTEGYIAAVAGGWIAGTNAALLAKGYEPICLNRTTIMGALTHFISSSYPDQKSNSKRNFQPMPANFGLLPDLDTRIREKRMRYGAYRDRSLEEIAKTKTYMNELYNQRNVASSK